MSADDLETWSSLVAVYQTVLHDVVSALENDADMDSGMFSVLAHLARAESPGSLPLGELQRLMHPRYSQPGLSRLVQRMEQNELVTRSVSAADGRAVTIRMTRRGRSRYERANDVYNAAVHEHFGAFLSPTERTRMANELDRVIVRRRAYSSGNA